MSGARSRRRQLATWGGGLLLLSLISLAVFAANATLAEVHPGSVWGLAYGIVAAVLMLAALLHGLRRRAMRIASRLRLGRSSTWLDLHVYGGLLFMLLVLMHSGFRLPTGTVTSWLWGLSVWITLSGLIGLGLKKWLPRVLASGLSTEAHYDRIPELCQEISERALKVASTCGTQVRALYKSSVAPALVAPKRRLIFFFDITGGSKTALKEFNYLRQFLDDEERERLRELERLYRTKIELDAHYTLQQALRGWLMIHTPVAILLVAFLAIHIFSVLYY